MGLRDEIRSFTQNTKPPVLAVPTPELPQWDGQIFVRRVSPRAFANFWLEGADEEDFDERARFAVLAASDADGSRIFQDEDILWLTTCELLTPMVERLYWAGRFHNGLTEENRTSWRKNSPSTGGGGSPSSCAEQSTQVLDSTSTGS
jgi:hypothetical protein